MKRGAHFIGTAGCAVLSSLDNNIGGDSMKQGRRAVLGMALLGGVGHVFAGKPQAGTSLGARLKAIAEAPECQLASLSVLAIRNGKISYQFQSGHRFIGAGGLPSRPANEHTLYRMASISKMMTTLGLMRLVEEGKLSLDRDAGDYLGYPLRNPHFPGKAVTLRALLSHTSTLRDDAGYSFPAEKSLKSLLLPGGELHGSGVMWAPTSPPGQYFTYSNLNWGVIGTIMERVTGERFDRLMKRLLLDPMGLHGGYNPSEFSPEDLSNLATLYRKRTVDTEVWNANGPWIPQVDDYSVRPPARPAGIDDYLVGTNATPFSPTGGMRMSARDMGKVMLMLMNKGRHEGEQLLQPATLDMMFARQWAYDGGNGDTDKGLFNIWGLGNQHFPDKPGMQLVEGGGFAGVGHLGEAYGLMSVFAADLANKNGMVVLVGGVSSDPEAYKGKYSAMPRFEEQVLTSLYKSAIVGK
jgi:CubicO group peptidase (beta-lactamase class C family)